MAIDVSYRDTFTTSAEDLSRFAKNFLINEGVVKTGFNVTQSGTPAMTVAVAPGTGYFYGSGTNANVMYEFYSDASETVTIGTAGVQARIDIICLKVDASTGVASIVAVAGTPSGSPAVPATPASHYKLAEVAVGISVTTITNANITIKKTITSLALEAYPIGSVYTSIVNTNPSNFFGGVWTAFASGRTLVGVDTGQTEFDTVEETGGAKTHTHTINGHTHSVTTNNHTHSVTTSNHTHTVSGNTSSSQGGGSPFGAGSLGPDGNHTHNVNLTSSSNGGQTITSSSAGGETVTSASSGTLTSNSDTTLQPYITVYFFKRTA